MHLRMMLSFADCVLEIASLRAGGQDLSVSAASLYAPQDSVVVDQISQLSKEWRYEERSFRNSRQWTDTREKYRTIRFFSM